MADDTETRTAEEPLDSANDWVAEHTRRYVETDGADGHIWRDGVPTLVLTTRGRKTGQLRRNALIYGTDGDDHVVVASRGGADHDPAWYLNLVDEPTVHVQVGAEKFTARARTATEHEKPRLWTKMAALWPDYDSYQARTSRPIPVVILERVTT